MCGASEGSNLGALFQKDLTRLSNHSAFYSEIRTLKSENNKKHIASYELQKHIASYELQKHIASYELQKL